MTLFPAKTYGIENRGQIKVGMKADIVLFDANKIQDKATFIDPYQYPEGIHYVLINGELVVDKGEYINSLNGEVLRK